MVWGGDIQEQVLKKFNLESKDKECIAARLVDCFGLFNYLSRVKDEH